MNALERLGGIVLVSAGCWYYSLGAGLIAAGLGLIACSLLPPEPARREL